MNDPQLIDKISNEWMQWKKCSPFYPDITDWWKRHMKKRLQILIRGDDAEKNKNFKMMENHLYQCIYDMLRTDLPDGRKLETLKKHKAHIVRLHANLLDRIPVDIDIKDRFDDEEPSLFRTVRQIK
jgi:hypothetical protein